MASLGDLIGTTQYMRNMNEKRALGYLLEQVDFDDAGEISRLHLRVNKSVVRGKHLGLPFARQ